MHSLESLLKYKRSFNLYFTKNYICFKYLNSYQVISNQTSVMDVFLDISNTIIFDVRLDGVSTKNNSSKKLILWLNVRNWWLKKSLISIIKIL